ncbi:MAG: VWA domain-containing protein [Paludibacter sp.]|nr:VWA domain-containing protein [Paludibacter sp.]
MKKTNFIALALSCILFISCESAGGDLSLESSSKFSGDISGSGGGELQAGVITAGEWNDLDNWMFLDSLLKDNNFFKVSSYWGFYRNHRISVQVNDASNHPVVDAIVLLKRDGSDIWSARTGNSGKAELWVDLYQKSEEIDSTKLQLVVGNTIISSVKTFYGGVNVITLANNLATSKNVELAFVVDATGSMGDELEFLKTELLDVINRTKTNNPTLNILTGSVFYRDKGDDYVTRISNFNTNIQTTLNFIKDQKASGGGDFPEAVHTALDKAINELQWSTFAHTRLLFLVLDAPPHYEPDIVSNLQVQIKKASEKGIKIIPITASGIDKDTEFLMRFMAVTTNGTYVFITNDSGVGNEHLTATVGKYEVEKLNDLMVRLINKYVK